MIKLHKQFGHASYKRLKSLLKNAGVSDQNTFEKLEQICKECNTCLLFKKPLPRPAVGLPLASDFNETVAMDLHELGQNVWYLHLIDEFTCLSAASIIHMKAPLAVMREFLRCWVSIYGTPKKIYGDNGGEFNNADFRDLTENFGFEVKTRPAESSWCNGLLERHNSVLTEILLKIKGAENLDWETALSWALFGKNALHSVHGFSPYQLVFGKNPQLPSVITDLPPALEATTISQVVADNINAMYASRKAFIEAESSERIRRPSERMFEHMMKITKLEIKSTINVLIQINGEDQDIILVEMELWYLYAMEEYMLEFTSVDFRELTMAIKRML